MLAHNTPSDERTQPRTSVSIYSSVIGKSIAVRIVRTCPASPPPRQNYLNASLHATRRFSPRRRLFSIYGNAEYKEPSPHTESERVLRIYHSRPTKYRTTAGGTHTPVGADACVSRRNPKSGRTSGRTTNNAIIQQVRRIQLHRTSKKVIEHHVGNDKGCH